MATRILSSRSLSCFRLFDDAKEHSLSKFPFGPKVARLSVTFETPIRQSHDWNASSVAAAMATFWILGTGSDRKK